MRVDLGHPFKPSHRLFHVQAVSPGSRLQQRPTAGTTISLQRRHRGRGVVRGKDEIRSPYPHGLIAMHVCVRYSHSILCMRALFAHLPCRLSRLVSSRLCLVLAGFSVALQVRPGHPPMRNVIIIPPTAQYFSIKGSPQSADDFPIWFANRTHSRPSLSAYVRLVSLDASQSRLHPSLIAFRFLS